MQVPPDPYHSPDDDDLLDLDDERDREDRVHTAGSEMLALAAGFFSFVGVITLFYGLYRIVIPMILATHMPGVGYIAFGVGAFGTFGIVILAIFLMGRVAKLFK